MPDHLGTVERMRAVVYDKTGDSSVLELVDRDVAEPHWGDVRVKLAVAGVNPTDWKARSGATASDLPFDEIVPGQDGAGVVDAVGNGVNALHGASGSGSTSPSTSDRPAPPRSTPSSRPRGSCASATRRTTSARASASPR